MAYRIRHLNEYLRGWVQYFGFSQYYRPLPELDAWLRRRLRMCFWKHWRSVRTKVRELLKRGTAKKTALLTALSRKGPWHLSRTVATQTGNGGATSFTPTWTVSRGSMTGSGTAPATGC